MMDQLFGKIERTSIMSSFCFTLTLECSIESCFLHRLPECSIGFYSFSSTCRMIDRLLILIFIN